VQQASSFIGAEVYDKPDPAVPVVSRHRCSLVPRLRIDLAAGAISDLVHYSMVINTGLNAETSSGSISIPVSGGTGLYLQVTTQPGCGIFLGPNNVQVNVEYVMQ